MKVQFFMAMIPPTKTYQEKKIAVVKGKPVFYEPPEVKAVRENLRHIFRITHLKRCLKSLCVW